MSQHSTFRSLLIYSGGLLPLGTLLLLTNVSHALGQTTAQALPALSVGERRPGEIVRSKPHSYPIHLEAGQYLKIVVTQAAIDLSMQLLDTKKLQIAQVNRDSQGPAPEVLETVAEKSGEYILGVIAMENSAQPMPYEVHLAEVRAATPHEQQLAKAERKQCESQDLRNKGKYDAAIPPALEALALRKESLSEARDEQNDYAEVLNHLGNLYREAGDFINAQSMYEEARRVWMKILAPDHVSILSVLNNLGLELLRYLESIS